MKSSELLMAIMMTTPASIIELTGGGMYLEICPQQGSEGIKSIPFLNRKLGFKEDENLTEGYSL